MTKHDKVARIIGLANELGVKIDTSKKKGKKNDKHRKVLPHKS